MEYHVPQFIEVEDKLIGPLTLMQFIYLAGTAGICVVFFSFFPFVFAFLLSAPVAAFGGALAFYKVNGKPFISMLEAAVSYYFGEKLMLWKAREPEQPKAAAPAAPAPEPTSVRREPRLTRGKLSELAWSLDVKKNTNS